MISFFRKKPKLDEQKYKLLEADWLHGRLLSVSNRKKVNDLLLYNFALKVDEALDSKKVSKPKDLPLPMLLQLVALRAALFEDDKSVEIALTEVASDEALDLREIRKEALKMRADEQAEMEARDNENARIADAQEQIAKEVEHDPSAALQKLCQPTIWLYRGMKSPSGNCYFGGLPTLPANLSWPCHGNTGLPLHFLTQVDLSVLPTTPLSANGPALPREGFLFFFADLEEEMLWDDVETPTDCTRVLYSPTIGAPTIAPSNLPHIGHEFGKQNASGNFEGAAARGEEPSTTFPKHSFLPLIADSIDGEEAYFGNDFNKLATSRVIASIEQKLDKPIPQYDDHSDFRLAAIGQHRPSKKFKIVRHQMLGAPVNVQGAAKNASAKGLVSLLQIDSDFGIHQDFVFCDMGMIQFWIHPDDLAQGNFDNAFATTEGG